MIFHREKKKKRQSEDQFQTLLQTAMDGFWLADVNGKILQVNKAYCQMSGYTEQELLTMRITDLESAETADATATHIQTIITNGEDRFESKHHKKDGSVFDVEVNVQFKDIEGGRFVAFLQDITERKEAEKKIVESEARHSSMILNISDVIGIIGADGFMKYKSPNIEKYFGWKPEDLIGTDGWLTVHPDDIDRIQKEIEPVFSFIQDITKLPATVLLPPDSCF